MHWLSWSDRTRGRFILGRRWRRRRRLRQREENGAEGVERCTRKKGWEQKRMWSSEEEGKKTRCHTFTADEPLPLTHTPMPLPLYSHSAVLRYLQDLTVHPPPLLFACCQRGDEISGITLPSVILRPLFCWPCWTNMQTFRLVILKGLISVNI